MAGLLWAGGDLALLLIDAGHDLRVARILLGRINTQLHATSSTPATTPGGAGGGAPHGGETMMALAPLVLALVATQSPSPAASRRPHAPSAGSAPWSGRSCTS